MTSFTIMTVGYSPNYADSEQMAGLLKEAKFELLDDEEKADIVIFNTCMVGPTESAFLAHLQELKEKQPYKIIIIAGCIPQFNPSKVRQYSLLGNRSIHKIVEVVEEALHDNVLQMLEHDGMPPLDLPRVRRNPIVEILPINRGCVECCFWSKPQQRESLVSYPMAEIIAEAGQALQDGVKEIWLTSQDAGCYGFDLGTDLPTLLKELVKLPGDFKIRIGTTNPEYLLKIKNGLFPLLLHPKIFQFLHLSVLAGNDYVLKKMTRNYTAEEFISAVQELRAQVPEITLMTDITVGFPAETDEQHFDTLTLLRKTAPDVVNISQFWRWPKTPAAKLESLSAEVVSHRSKVITDMFCNIAKIQNERWLGWEGEILIDEKGSEKEWIGRNYTYKPVKVEGDFVLGQKVKVKINSAGMFDLGGEVLKSQF